MDHIPPRQRGRIQSIVQETRRNILLFLYGDWLRRYVGPETRTRYQKRFRDRFKAKTDPGSTKNHKTGGQK